MPRHEFDGVLEGIRGKGLFVQRYGGTKKCGITLQMRGIAALRILSYEKRFDKVDD